MIKLTLVITLFFCSFAHAVKCADFDTQVEAQAYMEEHQYYRLDGDGEACECLPGGSKHGTKSCR